MTRCKAFYRKVRELKDMEEVMKFCGKQDNIVYKIRAHMAFMDKHFPEWDKEECTIVQIPEGATRVLRRWERKDLETFNEVMEAVSELDKRPTTTQIKSMLGKASLDRTLNSSPRYYDSMYEWAEEALERLREEAPAIISRYDTIRTEIDKWEERWHPMEHVQIDREGNITCDLSLCENSKAVENAKTEIGNILHVIWTTRPERKTQLMLYDVEDEIKTILHIFKSVYLAEKRAFSNIGLDRVRWRVPYGGHPTKDYTAEELRTLVQESTDRLIQDYSALLEERNRLLSMIETLEEKPALRGVDP